MKASTDCHNNFNQSTARSKKLQARIILLQLLLKYKDPKKNLIRHAFAVFRQNSGTLSEKERVILHSRRLNMLNKSFATLKSGLEDKRF